MAQGFVNQVANSVPGMEVVAISNRHLGKAVACYEYGNVHGAVLAEDQDSLDALVASGTPAVTEDPLLLTRSEQIDCLIDMASTSC